MTREPRIESEAAPEYVTSTRAPERLIESRPVIRGPEDVAAQFWRAVAVGEQREHFVVIYVDSRNAPKRDAYVVSIGSLNASLVHPREVLAPALECRAASFLVAHNHPSGDCTPSPEDLAITQRLVDAGRLLGVELLDHVVTAAPGVFVSMKERRVGGFRL
jgi:DNA repair protein RadC